MVYVQQILFVYAYIMCQIKILLFLLLLVLIIQCYSKNIKAVVTGIANLYIGGNNKIAQYEYAHYGSIPENFIHGGAGEFDIKGFIYNSKNTIVKPIMIVDVANLHSQWHTSNFKKTINYFNQQILFKYYLEAMRAHNKIYKDYNCHYVIKNFRSRGKLVFNITDTDLKLFQMFCKNNGAFISIAQDYTGVKKAMWDSERYHYVRERDDYLCLWLAKLYKINYINVVIMTNDKFKDFSQFGFIPEFIATHINSKKKLSIKVKPKPNILGQLSDYKIVPVKL